MKRHPTRELLDTDAGTPAEVAASIRDLQWFNRWFGGIPTVRELLRDAAVLSGRARLSVLDIAAGDGFLPGMIGRELEDDGTRVHFTLLDRRIAHLPRNGIMPKVAADALQLPFADETFDFVSCSLFLHHLSELEVVAFGKEAFRVARHGLLVHDLIRNPVHLAFAYAGLPLYRSRITRNDAPASVRQAYTTAEIAQFMREAGAAKLHVHKHFFYRMGVVARKAVR
jgi:ubiquinone/menaquinone biosynthesis C-methylase UbiE